MLYNLKAFDYSTLHRGVFHPNIFVSMHVYRYKHKLEKETTFKAYVEIHSTNISLKLALSRCLIFFLHSTFDTFDGIANYKRQHKRLVKNHPNKNTNGLIYKRNEKHF